MSRQDRPALPEHPPSGIVDAIVKRATRVDMLANAAAIAIIAAVAVAVFWRFST